MVEPGQVACDGAVVTPVATGNLQRQILSDAGLELTAESVFVQAAGAPLGVALQKWKTRLKDFFSEKDRLPDEQ